MPIAWWNAIASLMAALVAAGLVPISSNLRMSLSLPLGRRLQRPGRRDAIAPHVEEAGAGRREQPLVQADAVVIHLEVAQLEREVRQRVRAVDDGHDAALRGPCG